MSRYRITESVGRHVESVHRYEDLEKHHPSSGREPGRQYETIDGRLEEVRHVDGRTFVKKDMIFSVDDGRPADIPSPAAGYVRHLRDATNAVRIYDRPYGTPGARMLAQVLHMEPGTTPADGSRVDYGARLGRMGDTGTPGSVHAHIEMEPAAFRQYIRDINSGVITPDRHPARGPAPDAMADGVLRLGETGPAVRALQQRLHDLGIRDGQGRVLPVDGDFGPRTEQAVRNFQRARGLEDDGIAGRDTLGALRQPAQPPPATPPSGRYGPTPLSDLIGRGEGGYGSFNRGRAGDARGATLDFSEMTVGEVMRRQSLPHHHPQYLFAVGKFQIVPATLRETVERLGVDPSTRFTPDVQERMFAEYLVSGKRPAVRDYITGAGGPRALGAAQLALAQEFASVADPRTGRGYYDGDSAGNHASISAAQVQQALDHMRESYRANVQRGMSPAEAYAAIGGGAPVRDAPGQGGRPEAPREPVLRLGDRGAEVERVQAMLRRHGATDARGRAIEVDGDFGPRTDEAVRRFQRAQRLEDDGIVGPGTRAALAAPAQRTGPVSGSTPALGDPAHPDARLFAQAKAAMDRLEASIGRSHDATTDRAAAQMVVAARREGLASIDHVLLGDDGRRLFAVQGELGSPHSRMAFVDTQQAVRQSVEESGRQLAAIADPAPAERAMPQRALTI
ncbi:peptidoglycan-binding protein [Lysobacter humi (ex Lee et al. 2017)]